MSHEFASSSPNIILLCVDQMRADAMSCAGNPVVQTPYLDMLAAGGTRFEHCYSATPTCVPARVALFTGKSQEHHGRVGYTEGVPFSAAYPVTMPGELRRHGYQTQAIGKMHVYPERDRAGFDDVRLHDGYLHYARREHQRNLALVDDYLPWLHSQPGMNGAAETDHGIGCNSLVARPWDKPEALHPTSWVMSEAINWLYRRDTTVPFFLYLSWHRPHAPYDPPQWAFDQYQDQEIPPPPRGDWVDDFPSGHRSDYHTEAKFGTQRPDVRRRAIQGYYGSITHIDTQINRLMEALNDFDLLDNTAFLFVSDHGDMLGDHDFYRKSVGYEGSAHVPFLVKLPGQDSVATVDEVVELRDVMPTVLDIAGVPIPDTVDGRSVLPLILQEQTEWRHEIHGEHFYEVFGAESMQWVTDGHRKYVWWSGSGLEQFFDLDQDPQELHNLIGSDAYSQEVQNWRSRLVSYLEGREEGYVVDHHLAVGQPVNDHAWVRRLYEQYHSTK